MIVYDLQHLLAGLLLKRLTTFHRPGLIIKTIEQRRNPGVTKMIQGMSGLQKMTVGNHRVNEIQRQGLLGYF
jgi:hypothetical protein